MGSEPENIPVAGELETIRTDFRRSIETAQAAATRAATIGDKVIAALKPIDLALKDLNNRIRDLNNRIIALEGGTTLNDLKSSIDGRSKSLDKNSGAIERINSSQRELEQRLTGVIDQVSTLDQRLIEIEVERNKDGGASEAIDPRVAELKTAIENLATRVEVAEKTHSDLSGRVDTLANQPSTPNGLADVLAERIASLERRITELETSPPTAPSSSDEQPAVDAKAPPQATIMPAVSRD